MERPAIAFDTHRFVKRLTESGFTETLAEEPVALLNANLVTEADIAAVKADIAPCDRKPEPASRR